MKKILLSLGSLMISAAAFCQTFNPVSCTGWNIDGIAENTPPISYTTSAIDGSDYVLYSYTFGTIVGTYLGLPDNGTITSGTRTYQLQDYASNNILFMTAGLTDSLTLTPPTAYAELSLLAFSTEGTGPNTVTVNFVDGTSYVVSISLPDWFSGASPSIINGFDRVGRTTGTPDYDSYDPFMYPVDLTMPCASQSKPIRSIVVTNNGSGPRTCVFAVSGVAASTYSITNTDPTCHGGTGSASIIPATDLTPFSYAWSTSPAQYTDTATGLPAGTYTVSATDGLGCTVLLTDTITQPAGGTLIITASSDSVCAGHQVTLTTTGANTYVWSVPSSFDSTVTVTVNSTQVYSVTGTGAGGCSGAGSKTIVVRTPPAIGITASPSASLCQGQDLTLTATGGQTYSWEAGVTPGVPFAVLAAATYSVTGTDSHGCTSSDTLTVSVFTKPPVLISAVPSDSICSGTMLRLVGTGAPTYTWSGGVSNGVEFSPTISGEYYVTASAGGCTNTDSIAITVLPSPTVSIAVSPANDTVCAGMPVTLTASGATTYSWTAGISNGVAFTPGTTTTYAVTGSTGSCNAIASVSVIVKDCTTGIDDIQAGASMTIYPNPNNGHFTITINGDAAELTATLLDLQGRAVYSTTLSDVHAGEARQLSISGAAAGIYLLDLQAGAQRYVQKLVIGQ